MCSQQLCVLHWMNDLLISKIDITEFHNVFAAQKFMTLKTNPPPSPLLLFYQPLPFYGENSIPPLLEKFQKLIPHKKRYSSLLYSTIEYNQITLSILYTIFSTKIKKKERKSKLVKRKKKRIYASATRVFEKYNFSCGITSLLNRKSH